MKRYFLLLSFLLAVGYSFGQDLSLKGKIMDAQTNEPLPYATIELHSLRTGTIANNSGDFELSVNSMNQSIDTLEFSYLGYDKRAFSVADFLRLENKTISLKSSNVSLGEVVVLPQKYKTVELGILDKKSESWQVTNLFNNKIGNYIANKKQQIGWIRSVSFYIDTVGHPETPFRVRIYDLNHEKNCPGDDILNENVIVSAKEPGWFSVDLTNFKIQFPVDGMFVMMEWINSGDKYFHEKEMHMKNENGQTVVVRRKFYGQVIGSVFRQPKMITWGITLGNDWIPYKLYSKGYINAMIRAEIAYPLN